MSEPKVSVPKGSDFTKARAFDDVTDTPCPRCLKLAWADKMPVDMVMPMPKERAPVAREPGGQHCCHDCSAADGLRSLVGGLTFEMARIAVGNDRREGLRMPRGMMECFGTCKMGFTRPSSIEDLEAHYDFLKKNHIQLC